MNRRWHFIASLVFAWLLWERVDVLNSQSQQWITQGSYTSQEICISNASRIIDILRTDYLRRGATAAYVINEGLGGFFVNDKEKHIFVCSPSDFDPRPRK